MRGTGFAVSSLPAPRVEGMLTELAVFGALTLVTHWFWVLLAVCAVSLISSSISWRALEDRPPFLCFAARGVRNALAARSRIMRAAQIMTVAAVGFVMGWWPGWLVAVVAVFAVRAAWGALVSWLQSREARPPSSASREIGCALPRAHDASTPSGPVADELASAAPRH